MIPLTKTLSPNDYAHLTGPLIVIDRHDMASQTNDHRRWEYAMASVAVHAHSRDPRRKTLDVGGTGSPLRHILFDGAGLTVQVADPAETIPLEHVAHTYDVVTCVSVLEHVPDLYDFCDHLARVVALGGVLFLTMDIWDHPINEPDTAHFSWLRERIFTVESWKDLAEIFFKAGFRLHGEADWNYYGDALFPLGYSLCSLSLVKGGEKG